MAIHIAPILQGPVSHDCTLVQLVSCRIKVQIVLAWLLITLAKWSLDSEP